jgi:hypothetical protein
LCQACGEQSSTATFSHEEPNIPNTTHRLDHSTTRLANTSNKSSMEPLSTLSTSYPSSDPKATQIAAEYPEYRINMDKECNPIASSNKLHNTSYYSMPQFQNYHINIALSALLLTSLLAAL